MQWCDASGFGSRRLKVQPNAVSDPQARLCLPLSEWSDVDYDVLADGVVVGRIFKAHAAPVGMPWM
jgi:hypothetical protein